MTTGILTACKFNPQAFFSFAFEGFFVSIASGVNSPHLVHNSSPNSLFFIVCVSLGFVAFRIASIVSDVLLACYKLLYNSPHQAHNPLERILDCGRL